MMTELKKFLDELSL